MEMAAYHRGDMAILRETIQAGNKSLNQGQDLAGISGVGKTERQGDALGMRFGGEAKND